MAKQQDVSEVFVHCFMDGRDTPPESGLGFLREVQQKLREIGVGKIATVEGRYYAMDRDKRWERIEKAFGAMVLGSGERVQDPEAAILRSYEKGITDEFIEPMTLVDARNEPVGLIREDDACFFFNYRADRGREMTEALTSETLLAPSRTLVPKNLKFATMTQYDKSLSVPFVLTREPLQNILGYVCGELQLEESAYRGDREVRARNLLLQWRNREAVCRRRARNGGIAEGSDLRSEAGNERAGHHGYRA